jgi:hypothetical protein
MRAAQVSKGEARCAFDEPGVAAILDLQGKFRLQGVDALCADHDMAQKDDEPKLCPDPGPDVRRGPNLRADAYQEQISALNNPQRPLPTGLAVSLYNPITGEKVTYDECRERDGTMIEAKGPGYGSMLRAEYFRVKFTKEWIKQASREVDASGGRPLEWYFTDREAAEFARKLFDSDKNLQRIQVFHVPANVS